MTGLSRIVRRHLRVGAGGAVVLALVALVAAAVGSAVPRALADVHADQLTYVTERTSPISRDVISVANQMPGYVGGFPERYDLIDDPSQTSMEPIQPDWEGYLAGMGAVVADQPGALRAVLGAGDLVYSSQRMAVPTVEGNDVAHPGIVLRAGPAAADHVEIVEGRWPEPTEVLVNPGQMLPGADGVPEAQGVPMEVAVSVATAAELGWTVGSVHTTDPPTLPDVVVVGTWEAADAGSDYWWHVPQAVTPEVVFDANRGKIATATVFADPGTVASWGVAGQARLWYPVDTATVTADAAPALLAQLRGLTNRTTEVVPGDAVTLAPGSGLIDVLTETLAQRHGVDSIVAVLAAGPLGALVAVLVLGGRLVLERRRSALALMRSRGASGVWLRAVLALEVLVVSLPAAALGYLLGAVVVPGPSSAAQIAVAAAAGVAPAVVVAATASPRGLRTERADLDAPRRSRLRLVAEGLVLAAAAVTTWLLLDRGVAPVEGIGVDPLLAAAPLLLCVAGTLLALRAVPLVARAVERSLARRSDLVPFLGAARATRDTSGGLVPALALVLGVAVAASSAVLSSTTSAAVERAAWASVGADLRFSGPLVEDAVGTLTGMDEVDAATGVADLGTVALGVGGAGPQVRVFAVDAVALDRIQGGRDDVGPIADLAADGDRLGVLAVGLDVQAGASDLRAGSAPVDVLGTATDVAGMPVASSYLLVDAARAAELLGRDDSARIALVGLADGSAPTRAAVEQTITSLLPTAVVDDPVLARQALLAAPSSAGLSTAFTVAMTVSAALSVVAVVLTLVLAAPARGRLLAVLRTLGLRRGAERGLVLAEILPWSIVALVVGAAAGWAVPRLVLAATDLSPLTGGGEPPTLVVDPVQLAALTGGFVVVVVLGTVIAAALGRRRDAGVLRVGAD